MEKHYRYSNKESLLLIVLMFTSAISTMSTHFARAAHLLYWPMPLSTCLSSRSCVAEPLWVNHAVAD